MFRGLLLMLLTRSIGQRKIYYAFSLRAPPASTAPAIVPGAASGVKDVLLLPLLPLFYSCSGAAAMYGCCTVLLLLLNLLVRNVLVAAPSEHGYYASESVSVMRFRILKVNDGYICFASGTNTVSRLTFISHLGGGLVPA